MNKLVIIDGNAIVHRAYHALPPLTTKKGQMVNAVYGFTSMLLKVIHDIKPTHLAVTFDLAAPTFRHKKYTAYKATRVKADQELYDQIPLCHEVARAFNFPIYEQSGYEADDAIGTIVKKAAGKDTEIFIVTGDMDTLQLIQPGVKVYALRKGLSDIVIYDTAAVKERFGFGPELMVDYKALRGDASDNIPGVSGIGEKGAGELIQKVGGIKEIYKKINQLTELGFKPGIINKLKEGEKSAEMSHELSQIEENVPDLGFKIQDCEIKDFDKEKILKLFQEFEFVSLLKRVPGFEQAKVPAKEKKSGKTKTAKGNLKFVEMVSAKEVVELVKKIHDEKRFACRALLSGKDVYTSEFFGLAIVLDGHGYYVKKEFIDDFKKIFDEEKIEVVGHDLKQLIKILTVNKIKIANPIFDVMVASYLLAPGSRAHDAASVVLKVLGKELPAGAGQESLFGVNTRGAVEELALLYETADKLKQELIKTDDLGLFQKVEMPLIPVLAEMELNGVAVDLKLLAKLSEEAKIEIKKLTQKIYKMSGEEFNISSPLQLREVLFEKMDIPVEGIKKGKTGLSTSAEELEKLRGLHPIIDEISNYRELSKLQNTYIDVLPTLLNKKTGRIHTTFNQAVTATGRLSSSDPNLQNIPIRTELGREVRKAFIAEPGNILVSADYSQIELRIVASLAEDKRMMEIFEKGEDIHNATAAAINGVPLDKVTKEMRRAAKEVNFGVLYGMGAYGLSWRAEISPAEAKDFIDKYFSEFSGVKKYIEQNLAFTKKEGYCETLFGRRRYLPELKSSNYQLRAAAERMAINHPVQGTAADLMKMAMIEVSSKLKIQNSKPGEIKMLLQVHDELVFEVKKGLEKEVGELVKETMENVVKLRVPIRVDVHSGHSWGEIK